MKRTNTKILFITVDSDSNDQYADKRVDGGAKKQREEKG